MKMPKPGADIRETVLARFILKSGSRMGVQNTAVILHAGIAHEE
jgi:hypothetical protein